MGNDKLLLISEIIFFLTFVVDLLMVALLSIESILLYVKIMFLFRLVLITLIIFFTFGKINKNRKEVKNE